MDNRLIFEQEGKYFAETEIMGIKCTVGYYKEFRWSWMATQLNTFVIIGETDKLIDVSLINAFSMGAFNYATANSQGWPRGFQAGIGSIAILTGDNVDPSATTFVSTFSRKHWSAFEFAIVYNNQQRMAYRNRDGALWGAIYMPYFGKLMDRITGQL